MQRQFSLMRWCLGQCHSQTLVSYTPGQLDLESTSEELAKPLWNSKHQSTNVNMIGLLIVSGCLTLTRNLINTIAAADRTWFSFRSKATQLKFNERHSGRARSALYDIRMTSPSSGFNVIRKGPLNYITAITDELPNVSRNWIHWSLPCVAN